MSLEISLSSSRIEKRIEMVKYIQANVYTMHISKVCRIICQIVKVKLMMKPELICC